MSRSGRSPARRIICRARSTILTGSPMSRTKILPRASAVVGGRRQGRGLQHQLDRLAHRHEKPADLGMGDGQRPAGGELAGEQRHHRPGRAQHVAEAHRHKAGARPIAGPAARLVEVERLAEAFGEALGGAHHARRVDRLVGRDHHDQRGAEGARRLGDVAAADRRWSARPRSGWPRPSARASAPRRGTRSRVFSAAITSSIRARSRTSREQRQHRQLRPALAQLASIA